MKRLWIPPLLIAAFFCARAGAQTPIDCAPGVPCTISGPAGTGTGDPAYVAFGKVNANFALIPSQLFLGIPLPLIDGGTGANSLVEAGIASFTGSITAGHCAVWSAFGVLEDSGVVGCGGGGGGSSAWSALTTGTNTTGNFLIGTGATLGPTGSGTIDANELSGTTLALYFASPPAIGGTAPNAGAFSTLTAIGALTTDITGLTQCVHVNSSGVASGTGSDCNSGGGGSGTVSSASAGNIAYYPGAGTTVAGATLAGNIVFNGSTLTTSQTINPQTGTSYAMQATDAGSLLTLNNAGAVAVSLSSATTTGFTAGYSFDVENLGAGTVTITPTTSTINGAASLSLAQNTGCTITSDGTNYQVSACTAIAAGGSSWSNSASNSNTQGLGTGATGTYLVATNSSAATGTGSGNQAWSPATEWCGNGWKTNATAGSESVCWQMYMEPSSSTAAPQSSLVLAYNVNGTGWNVASTINEAGIFTGAGYYADYTTTAGVCSDCFYQIAANNPGISAGGVEAWSFTSTGSTAQLPVYTGGTSFTVSGCGSATSVTATGTTGSFKVGTGAVSCTFTITINGATGMTAAHGWVVNADDTTAPTQHCINGATVSPTTAVFTCAATVTTADLIKVRLDPY